MTTTTTTDKAGKPTKRRLAAIDRDIEAIYDRRCQGVQIDILDIGKVFAAGRAAALAGADVEAAIVARVAELARNTPDVRGACVPAKRQNPDAAAVIRAEAFPAFLECGCAVGACDCE